MFWMAQRIRGYANFGICLAGTLTIRAGHRLVGALLLAVGWGGFVRTYRRTRAEARAMTWDDVGRLKRLPEVRDDLYRVALAVPQVQDQAADDVRWQTVRSRLMGQFLVRYARPGGTAIVLGAVDDAIRNQMRAKGGVNGELGPDLVGEMEGRGDGSADVVIVSGVLEHLVDAFAGLQELNRVTRHEGIVLLVTGNASGRPDVSPFENPLAWIERAVGWSDPRVLSHRQLMTQGPGVGVVNPRLGEPARSVDVRFAFAELRDLARDSGFEIVEVSTIGYIRAGSTLDAWLRSLSRSSPALGATISAFMEGIPRRIPWLNRMGREYVAVLRKSGPARRRPVQPWWPASLAGNLPLDYMSTREDVAGMVPAGANDILDVGCAAGALGMRLGERGCQVTGIEINPRLARLASEVLAIVVEGDAAEILRTGRGLSAAGYDCIIFADCLEHLAQPDDVLRDAITRLRPRGLVVVSLPNVRHWDTIYNLAVRGVWPSRNVGIHDRTHLRYFTRKDAVLLLESCGLVVEHVNAVHRVIESRPSVLDRLARLAPGAAGELLTFQWLLAGRKPELAESRLESASQPRAARATR